MALSLLLRAVMKTPGLSLGRAGLAALVVGAAACSGSSPASPDAGPLPDAQIVDIEVPYGMNDVSVLFPLPASLADTNVLALGSAGNGGPLLSTDDFGAIDVFTVQHNPGQTTSNYDTWRIVAARIDPCFPDLSLLTTNPAMCRRQLRLVAQPMVDAVDGQPLSVIDSAIHLMYDLSEADFNTMARRFLAARTAVTGHSALALGVHPVIAAQGTSGVVARELRTTILAYAGSASLSQYTFMQGRTISWEFGGFRVFGGVRTPLQIFGIDSNAEGGGTTQITSIDADEAFQSTPTTQAFDALLPLAGSAANDGTPGGLTAVLTASQPDITAALQHTFDLETPSKFNPDTLDCSSCHIAGRARDRAEKLGASSDGLPRFEVAPFNLSLEIDASLRHTVRRQRAFGYRDGLPVWNQRVINESALIAKTLTTLLPQTSP